MRKLILLVLWIPIFAQAGEKINKSRITDVTVYQRGARITNEAEFNLLPGNNEIVISEITKSVDANSIQVRLFGDAILLSATTRIRQLEDKELPVRTKNLKDSIQWIDNEVSWLQHQNEVYNGEAQLIQQNQKLGSQEEKATVEEIIKLAEFYRTRILQIKKKVHGINKEVFELKKERAVLATKLEQLKYKEQRSVGEIVLKVSSSKAGKVKSKITYLTHQAGWTPVYDVRVSSADKPINLVYKANIYQTTGYSWNKTNLTISTGNPTANNNRPTMYPWYIDFIQPVILYKEQTLKRAQPSMQNAAQRAFVVDDAEPAPILNELSMGYSVVESSNSIAAEYRIEVPQEIPSDGKQHLVAIKEYELNSKFTYHAIPKLDKSAFLIAKVADYGKYNLLPGQSNLFFDGMYIGQSYLSPVTTIDSMLLSLGRDEKIIIKRNELKDLTTEQVIGANKKVTKAIEISVRNNNSFTIEMDLMDQVPLSKQKDIEVKLEDLGGAKHDADYGSLLWNMEIKPGETQKLKFVYSVKYPKDQNVNQF